MTKMLRRARFAEPGLQTVRRAHAVAGRPAIAGVLAVLVMLIASPAAAQLDPLLFVKKTKPNVLISIDVASRMQRDTDNNYRDNNVYPTKANVWEATLGVNVLSTCYRRKYVNLTNIDNGQAGSDKFNADSIAIVDDKTDSTSCTPGAPSATGGWSGASFDAAARINVAKVGLIEAINHNLNVARFGLLKMRQNSPSYANQNQTTGNVQPVNVSAPLQASPTDTNSSGKWTITRPGVGNMANGSVGTSGLLWKADQNVNSSIVSTLALATGTSGSGGLNSLIPAGNDNSTIVDAPVDTMITDLKTEAARLISSDTDCRNTVGILVVGGDQGNSDTATGSSLGTQASAFLNVSNGHRVPIYVILLSTSATTDTERSDLKAIATNSGGVFTEITPAMVNAVTPGQPVPEFVRAVNLAISNAFASQADFDKAPDATHPSGYSTEFQVTSPIIGTVNLENAKDINGNSLPNTVITNPADGVEIPQRSNVMLTSAFTLPGYAASLRAFRVYKPVADSTKSTGYSFNSDGTPLWVACAPGTLNTPCAATSADKRNIYTSLADGSLVAFTVANESTLKPYLLPSCTTNCDALATALITYIRSLPLGTVLDSTPAIMDAPSLDPPPDADYPAFSTANANRRSIIWVGGNDGMLHGIDGRLGQEVWAFIPYNLLPKLATLQHGQPTGDFRFFVDGSPKIADVKINGTWRTYLVMGEGAGGSFYQTFDVSLDNEATTVSQTDDNIVDVLNYFAMPGAVKLQWAFPKYADFNPSCTTAGTANACPHSLWGDLYNAAPAAEKTVGQTWSDPAIGQVETASGRFTVLVGSGFFRSARQNDANRAGVVAGSTFYLLDAKDGTVLDYKDVGNDSKAESTDNCGTNGGIETGTPSGNCGQQKNALQADIVATGPSDSRFVTKAYVGDLDGNIWRFDVGLDGSGVPKIKQLVKLYTLSSKNAQQPIYSSMATVSVGGALQYLFVGTGSDLLPSAGVNTSYALMVILDQGTSGSQTALVSLQAVDSSGGDEKVTSFPAVAGDIVFFSTTTFNQGGCSLPNANLYAMTFIGGPAYDTNGDGRLTTTGSGADSVKVRTTTGARASAPFIVDQHLVFASGSNIEMFGDPTDFNNGVGQAGVRILSWREVR